jgi:hypothetical protein
MIASITIALVIIGLWAGCVMCVILAAGRIDKKIDALETTLCTIVSTIEEKTTSINEKLDKIISTINSDGRAL